MPFFNYLIISVLYLSSFGHSNAQCEVNVSHEAKAVSASATSGSIQLKFEENETRSFEITLFRISGIPKKIESKIEQLPTTVLFKNLEAGDYVISIAQQDGCKVMIGGIDGITINDERK